MAMQVEMVISAQWYGEFVADLASERSRLGKVQVMRIARGASADETRPCEAGARAPSDTARPANPTIAVSTTNFNVLNAVIWRLL